MGVTLKVHMSSYWSQVEWSIQDKGKGDRSRKDFFYETQSESSLIESLHDQRVNAQPKKSTWLVGSKEISTTSMKETWNGLCCKFVTMDGIHI